MKANRTQASSGPSERVNIGRSLKAILGLLAAFSLVASACSSDGDAEDAATDVAAGAGESDAGDAEESDDSESDDSESDDTESDDSESDADAPDTADADDGEEVAAPTGESIKVMTTGVIESPVMSFPSMIAGAQIAVDEVNAAGGINGRPMELIDCNDEMDPSKATACVQTAVRDGIVSLIGGLNLFEAQLAPLLEAEGIPWAGSSSVTLTDSPILFTGSSGVAGFSGIGAAAVLRGCENVALFLGPAGQQTNFDLMNAGVVAFGGTVVGEYKGTGPDYSPLVESALADGAECIASGVDPGGVGGFLAAVAGRVPVSTIDGTLPTGLLKGLGEAADGLHVSSGFLLPGSGDENVLRLQALSEESFPGVAMDGFWFNGYVGVKTVAEALQGAEEPNAAAVLAGLPTISGFDTGVGPVLDYSKPNPVSSYSQIFNTKVYLYETKGGGFELLQEETLDVQGAIDVLGQG